jgi:hypothetical protein
LRANTVPVSYGIDVSGETGWALKRWRLTDERKLPDRGEDAHLTTEAIDRGRAFIDVRHPFLIS